MRAVLAMIDQMLLEWCLGRICAAFSKNEAQLFIENARVILGTNRVCSCNLGFFFFNYYRGGEVLEGSVGRAARAVAWASARAVA
jgi:hypothetical protein